MEISANPSKKLLTTQWVPGGAKTVVGPMLVLFRLRMTFERMAIECPGHVEFRKARGKRARLVVVHPSGIQDADRSSGGPMPENW